MVSGLLNFRWDDQDSGVLDRAHLRFFTRKTAMELPQQWGLRVTRLSRWIDWFEVPALFNRAVRRRMVHQEALYTAQFVIVAEKE